MQCPKCGKETTGDVCAACGVYLTEETPKWYAEGIAHLAAEGQYTIADELLQEGLQRYPASPMLWYNAGVLAEVTKKPRDAAAYYRRAFALKPTSEKYRRSLERVLGRPVLRTAPSPGNKAEAMTSAVEQDEESNPELASPLENEAPSESILEKEVPAQPEAEIPTPAEMAPPGISPEDPTADADTRVSAPAIEVLPDDEAGESTMAVAHPPLKDESSDAESSEIMPEEHYLAALPPAPAAKNAVAFDIEMDAPPPAETPAPGGEAASPTAHFPPAQASRRETCWPGWRPLSRISGYLSIAGFLVVLVAMFVRNELLFAVGLPSAAALVVLSFVARALGEHDPTAHRR